MEQDSEEELLVLQAIYGSDLILTKNSRRCFDVKIKCSKNEFLLLNVELPKDYPGLSPPFINLSASFLPKCDVKLLKSVLDKTLAGFTNIPIIFQVIENIKESIADLTINDCHSSREIPSSADDFNHPYNDLTHTNHVSTVKYHLQLFPKRLKPAESVLINGITHGLIMEEKKSLFQAHCMACDSVSEVSAFITELLGYKRVAQATHNIVAWYISPSNQKSFISGCDDDGEHKAGENLLNFLILIGAKNVVVMVSRWFGGIKLGPNRFKIINSAAKSVLDSSGLLPSKNSSTKH